MKLFIFSVLVTMLMFIQSANSAPSNIRDYVRGKVLYIKLLPPGTTFSGNFPTLGRVALDVENPDTSCPPDQFESANIRGFDIINDAMGRMHVAMLTAVKLNGGSVSIGLTGVLACHLGVVHY